MSASPTILPLDTAETEKTGETCVVSNGDFLAAVFGDDLSDARPLIVSFDGNPTNVPSHAWAGWPLRGREEGSYGTERDTNNYFSLAVFGPDEAGRFRRQKARFKALYAVMLDDVGTKVALERLTLAPSWLLETSPGNYQAGYLLREPLTDGAMADQLMNAIVAAALCDPGANGPRARLARLPEAVNGKHTPPFPCRMGEWFPERRYSVQELVDGLQQVLHDIADERGEINRRKLGWWIRRHVGRIVDGRRFVRAPRNRSAESWRVESVSPVSPVSPVLGTSGDKSGNDTPCSSDAYAPASRGA